MTLLQQNDPLTVTIDIIFLQLLLAVSLIQERMYAQLEVQHLMLHVDLYLVL